MRMCLSVLAASMLANTPVFAQSARPKTAGEIAAGTFAWGHNLTYVSNHFIKAAEAFPEDKYNYRPVDDVRSFAEIVMHVARVNHLNASDDLGRPPSDVSAFAFHSKAQALEVLRQSFADLAQAEKLKPNSTNVIDSEIHASEHYGNLVVYYRLNGLVPPSSR